MMTYQPVFTLELATARTPDELGDFALGVGLGENCEPYYNMSNWTSNRPSGFDDAVLEAARSVRELMDEDEEWGLRTRVADTPQFFDTLTAVKARSTVGDNTTARLIIMMHQRARAIRTDAL